MPDAPDLAHLRDRLQELAPVHFARGERGVPAPEGGLGLSLSGGGYRGLLFHTGALWRLNEAGMLPRLDRVSSVSGGSIAAGVLATRWDAVDFGAGGVGRAFERAVVAPVRDLARHTIDVRSVLGAWAMPGGATRRLAAAYTRRLFEERPKLGDLPARPAFVFNATDLRTGSRWPYRGGPESKHADVPVAEAVAASSAYPPLLSPGRPRDAGAQPVLTDGGVFDNLGLDETWKHCHTVLISDAGGKLDREKRVWTFWPLQGFRVTRVIDNQVRALRKRQAISGYETGLRAGAYWSLRSDIEHFPIGDKLPAPRERTQELATIPTRLRRLDDARQERLVNWGYAAADASLRAHVEPPPAPPRGLPYAERGI